MGFLIRGDQDVVIKKAIKRKIAGLEENLLDIMRYAGEQFDREAKENLNISGEFPKGDYQDRTANLRNSIGYCITKNGKIIDHSVSGSPKSVRAFMEAVRQFFKKDNDYHLYMVAGMEYASHLESKGYNVITSQAEAALVNMDRLFKNYQQRRNINIKNYLR